MRFLLLSLALALPNLSLAADLNGYTAKHECRIGNVNCDIDLVPPNCDIVIDTSDTSWNKIYSNNGARTFCVSAGDHTSKGSINLNFSGGANQRKWIRSTATQNPIVQSPGSRATVKNIIFNGGQYWVIDRIAVNGQGSADPAVWFKGGTNSGNNVINRSLLENGGTGYTGVVYIESGADDNAIQNSVIRNSIFVRDEDNDCINLSNVTGTLIVNNEIYRCRGKGIFSPSGGPIPNAIIENNDIYVDKSQQSDCNGNVVADGPCSGGESPIFLKSGGTLGKPVTVTKNRLWGVRFTDLNLCCGGGTSGAVVHLSRGTEAPQHDGADYVLLHNNLIMGGQLGVASYPDGPENISVVGNIFYQIRRYSTREVTGTMQLFTATKTEWYFNTVVDSDIWLSVHPDAALNDVRCNVAIASGSQSGQSSSDTTIVDNMVYANAADAKGTEYCFWRKLHTGAEQICIPHARPTSSSPHAKACASAPGFRTGIGINDAPLL